MTTMPTVRPRPYSEAELRDVEEVLRQGARTGHTAGVTVLRRAMAAQREFLELAEGFQFLVPPPPPGTQDAVIPRQRGHRREPRQPSPRQAIEAENAEATVSAPPCGHRHPIKGPCQRTAHPSAPGAHDYVTPVATRQSRPVPGVTFSSGSGRRAE